jgi:hypothetical protein
MEDEMASRRVRRSKTRTASALWRGVGATILYLFGATVSVGQEIREMPKEWESILGPGIVAVTTYDVNGVEQTYLKAESLAQGPITWPNEPVSQINTIDVHGVMFMSYEGSPDKKTACFPTGCYPVSHSH